jgi:hypothetical protein
MQPVTFGIFYDDLFDTRIGVIAILWICAVQNKYLSQIRICGWIVCVQKFNKKSHVKPMGK